MDEEMLPPAAPLPRQMQWRIVGGLAVVAVVAVALLSFIHRSSPEAADAAAAAGTFRPTKTELAGLKIATVESRVFRAETITDGKIAIDDDRTTPVFSPYSGRVTRLVAKPGDVVKPGQSLFAVDASEFVQGQNDLTVALATFSSTRMQLTVAETNEKRQHALYESNAGALKDWQQSQSDLAAAEAAARDANTALAAVRNRLRILGKSAKEIAGLEQAGEMKSEAIVTAPIGGTVIQRQVGVGQYIQSGTTAPEYTIADLSVVWLIANVRETDAPTIRLGQPVEVRVLAFPDRVFKAKIAYIAASVDPATRRVPVRAEVDNPDGLLKPEMFASFSIITGTESGAPGVPTDSVVYEGEAARVWVARADGTIELRRVQTGRIGDGMVEITSGLAAGEKIVTSGALFIDRAATAD